jgi:hypothetical protein
MPSARTAWILWGAMLVAVGNYVLVAQLIEAPRSDLADELPLLTTVFAGVAVVNALCSLLLAPLLGRIARSEWVALVARLLFAESIATLGFVLRMLGATQAVFLAFVAATVVLLALAAPTAASRSRRA